MSRQSMVKRTTSETDITLSLEIDGQGTHDISTGVPFFDHMLSHVTRHGLFDLTIKAKGDLEIDSHHTVEDVGLSLGQAFREALGEKRGIRRFGESLLPMDEALVMVALDFSGRPYLVYDVSLPREKVGTFDTELVKEFLKAFSTTAGVTLHVKQIRGENTHHIIEAIFKGLGKALDAATMIDPRVGGIPSTKGVL